MLGYGPIKLPKFGLAARPHEWRAALWSVGAFILIGMATVTLWTGLHA